MSGALDFLPSGARWTSWSCSLRETWNTAFSESFLLSTDKRWSVRDASVGGGPSSFQTRWSIVFLWAMHTLSPQVWGRAQCHLERRLHNQWRFDMPRVLGVLNLARYDNDSSKDSSNGFPTTALHLINCPGNSSGHHGNSTTISLHSTLGLER